MRRILPAALFLGVFLPAAGAQLSGTYSINKSGGNYKSFKQATVDLYLQGIKGPVKFIVAPGVYKESFYMFPCGATKSNTVTFFNPLRKGAMLQGNGTDIITVLGSKGNPCNWVIWDGIEFDNSPGAAIFINQQVAADWEIKNCTFGPKFGKSGGRYVATFYSNCSYFMSDRWNIHHNKFTLPATTNTYDGSLVYWQGAGEWAIHHNTIDLNGCANAISAWNQNYSKNRIYNNLIYGKLYDNSNSAIMRCVWSLYDIEFSHNTVVVDAGASCQRLIETGGCCNTRYTNYYGNIFYWTGPAAVYQCRSSYQQYFRGDGNIYWNPKFNPTTLPVGRDGATLYTLAKWQTTIKGEAKSKVVNPMLLKPTAPYVVPAGFRPLPASPAKDAAVEFPGYATFTAKPILTDFAGRFRDAKPDVGAFELSGFAVFGNGCPGSGKAVPAMGYQGTVSIPSTNFAVTLSKGLGGAPAFLVLGTSKDQWGPLNLPFPFGGGCNLYTGITAAFAQVLKGTGAGNGTAVQFIPIPNVSALAGNDIFFQWLLQDAGSGSSLGFTSSDGGALQL